MLQLERSFFDHSLLTHLCMLFSFSSHRLQYPNQQLEESKNCKFAHPISALNASAACASITIRRIYIIFFTYRECLYSLFFIQANTTHAPIKDRTHSLTLQPLFTMGPDTIWSKDYWLCFPKKKLKNQWYIDPPNTR